MGSAPRSRVPQAPVPAHEALGTGFDCLSYESEDRRDPAPRVKVVCPVAALDPEAPAGADLRLLFLPLICCPEAVTGWRDKLKVKVFSSPPLPLPSLVFTLHIRKYSVGFCVTAGLGWFQSFQYH